MNENKYFGATTERGHISPICTYTHKYTQLLRMSPIIYTRCQVPCTWWHFILLWWNTTYVLFSFLYHVYIICGMSYYLTTVRLFVHAYHICISPLIFQKQHNEKAWRPRDVRLVRSRPWPSQFQKKYCRVCCNTYQCLRADSQKPKALNG